VCVIFTHNIPYQTFLTPVQLFHSILPCDDVDIDECAVNNGGCSSDATCSNNIGSFKCTCLPGYIGDGFTCRGESGGNIVVLTKRICLNVLQSSLTKVERNW